MSNYSDIKIDWVSEVTASMGYGLQARRMLKPLIDGGADIKLIPDEDYLPPFMKIDDPYWNEQIEKSKDKPDSKIRISYCLPNRYKINPNAINIGYSMWETDTYPREWANIINNSCQYFFAGCNALVKSAEKAEIKVPIFPMNATIDTSQWSPEGRLITLNEVPSNCVKFLFIGNFIPRKNLQDLITGFNFAFQGVSDVALIIKTWSSNNSAESKRHICDAVRHMSHKSTGINRPRITVITDVISENQMIDLIRSIDVYTSVSFGEGFDLPMVQAMSMEKLIVSSRFLAHGDYLDDTNSINIAHSLQPCIDAQAPLYDSYQMWSQPHMDSYISGLRRAYSLVKDQEAKKYGIMARKTIEDKFGVKKNTDYLVDTIRSIRDTKISNEKTSKILIKELV